MVRGQRNRPWVRQELVEIGDCRRHLTPWHAKLCEGDIGKLIQHLDADNAAICNEPCCRPETLVVWRHRINENIGVQERFSAYQPRRGRT